MKRQRLSMKLLWKLYPEWERSFFDTDDGDDVKDFLEYVEQHMKSSLTSQKNSV